MNEISNFNTNLGPDPIKNSLNATSKITSVPKPPKSNRNNFAFNFAAIIFSLFLIVFSISLVFDLINKSQGQGEIVTNEEKGNISVHSEASVYATPDAAEVSFGIVTEATTMDAASVENTRKSTNIKNYIQGQGVSAENIKTTDFKVEPQYQKQTVGIDAAQYPEGRTVIVSYKITETLRVKITDVTNLGNVIQEALDTGASTVSDLTFIVENEEVYVSEARAEAIAQAEAQAKEIAQSLGVQLGDPISYSDNSFGDVYRTSDSLIETEDYISLGQNEIVVNSYIVYSIK